MKRLIMLSIMLCLCCSLMAKSTQENNKIENYVELRSGQCLSKFSIIKNKSEINSRTGHFVIIYGSNWSGPSRALLGKKLEIIKHALHYKDWWKIQFFYIDVDKTTDTVNLKTLPTTRIFFSGIIKEEVQGLAIESIKTKMDKTYTCLNLK